MVTGSNKREISGYQNMGQSGECHAISFREGYILEALMWTTMVLIPKVKGEYRGIVLVDTIWKFCMSIFNSRLQSSIVLHDVLHGFR